MKNGGGQFQMESHGYFEPELIVHFKLERSGQYG